MSDPRVKVDYCDGCRLRRSLIVVYDAERDRRLWLCEDCHLWMMDQMRIAYEERPMRRLERARERLARKKEEAAGS